MQGHVVAEQQRQRLGRQRAQDQRRCQRRQHRDGPEPPPAQPGAEPRPRRAIRPRQQRRQRPGQRHQPQHQQPDPGPAGIDEAHRAGVAAGDAVHPARRRGQPLGAVEHADVLDTGREDEAPRGAGGEALRRRGGFQPVLGQHAPRLGREPLGFQRADDGQQVARHRSAWPHGGAEGGDGDGPGHGRARLRRRGDGPAQHDVPTHGMAEQHHPPIAARQGAGEILDGGERGEQRPTGAAVVADAAGQGVRVAAMAREVEGHGEVAVAGEGRGEGQHELLRPGEAMGDDHDRAGRRAGRRAEHRQRDPAELGRLAAERRRRGLQPPDGSRHQRTGEQANDQPRNAAAAGHAAREGGRGGPNRRRAVGRISRPPGS